jgi:hypothetical protein
MNRVNRILGIALVVQIILVALVFLPRIIPASAESAPLFGDLTTDTISGLAVQDEAGNRVELVKGETWTVAGTDGFPADAVKIDGFLTKVVGVTTNPLVTRTSASHKRLQVADDEFARRIDLTLADGSTRTLFIGSSASGGSHVRAGGQDDVYLARDLNSFDAGATAASWIDATYFSVAQDQVTALTLDNANGTFEFEKDASGNWTMSGLAADEVFNANNLTSLLSRIASLRMNQPLGKTAQPEYGLDEPAAVINVTTTITGTGESPTTQTVTLRIGAKDESGENYFVSSSESEYYVKVPAFGVEDFVTRTRADFVQPPATPTATPEVTPTTTPEITSTLEITPTPGTTPSPTP